MDYVTAGDRYIVAWSTSRLIKIINLTANEKELIVMILQEDPAHKTTSNPVRELIVHGVSNRVSGFELWEVVSPLSEEQLITEFIESPHTTKQEIREVGELIYSAYQ